MWLPSNHFLAVDYSCISRRNAMLCCVRVFITPVLYKAKARLTAPDALAYLF